MKLVAVVGLALFTFGCASVVGPPPIDTSQLVAAGFKVVDIQAPLQIERLQTLPTTKVTEYQFTGKHLYLYPDAAKKQLYVGRPAEYQAYLKLSGTTAGPSLAQQSAADMASYTKQDAGMTMLTTRDENDPYWWSLDNIGWR